jgi:hypothetical protein
MDTLQDRPGTNRYTQHRRYKNGVRHTHELQAAERFTARADGPVQISLGDDGRVQEEWAAHHDPSTVKDYNHHQPTISHGSEIHTYLHRGDGPALVERVKGETIETWFRENKEYHPSAHERMKWEARKAANGGNPFHPETIGAMAGEAPRMGGHSETWQEVRPSYGKEEMEYHRPGAPACVGYDRKTGSVIHEEWFLDGKNKNPNGPYEKRYDPKTGVCVSETGNQPGRPHSITRNGTTGKVVGETWRDRDNGPYNVWCDPDTNRVYEDWPNKRSRFLPGKPTVKAAAAWQALKTKQGGPFTPGLDEVPAAQRTAEVKEAAAAAAAKAAEPKRKQQHQDER